MNSSLLPVAETNGRIRAWVPKTVAWEAGATRLDAWPQRWIRSMLSRRLQHRCQLAAWISAQGWGIQAVAVREVGLRDASDPVIVQAARAVAVLMTKDTATAPWSASAGGAAPLG